MLKTQLRTCIKLHVEEALFKWGLEPGLASALTPSLTSMLLRKGDGSEPDPDAEAELIEEENGDAVD